MARSQRVPVRKTKEPEKKFQFESSPLRQAATAGEGKWSTSGNPKRARSARIGATAAEKEEQEQPSRATKEGPPHLAQHVVTEPAFGIPATARDRCSIEVKEDPSCSDCEDSVSKAWIILAEAIVVARRDRLNVQTPKEGLRVSQKREEGPSIPERAKRVRRGHH